MDKVELKLCDLQGRLFENSADAGYESEPFIHAFMNSALAENLDSEYNRMQWAGEEYWMEELQEKVSLPKGSRIYPKDVLFWIGYLYRYWHYYTGENSRKILRIAPVQTMRRNYMMFHTMDPEMAVDDLKEIYRQRHPKAYDFGITESLVGTLKKDYDEKEMRSEQMNPCDDQ